MPPPACDLLLASQLQYLPCLCAAVLLLQVEQLFRDYPRVQTVLTPESSYKCVHVACR